MLNKEKILNAYCEIFQNVKQGEDFNNFYAYSHRLHSLAGINFYFCLCIDIGLMVYSEKHLITVTYIEAIRR